MKLWTWIGLHLTASPLLRRNSPQPRLAVPGVRAAIQEMAPDQAISDVSEFDEVVARLTAPQRLDSYGRQRGLVLGGVGSHRQPDAGFRHPGSFRSRTAKARRTDSD